MRDGFEYRLYTVLLTLLFLGLKLAGSIDWSWWWVFSPIWLFPAIFLFLVMTVLAIEAFIRLVKGED